MSHPQRFGWLSLLLAILVVGCGAPMPRTVAPPEMVSAPVATPLPRPSPLVQASPTEPVEATRLPTPDGPTVRQSATAATPSPGPAEAPRPPTAGDLPDCPATVSCTAVQLGNRHYNVANRPADGVEIRYIVIHDTQQTYADALKTFQDPRSNTSANYLIRSSDGLITQLVPNQDIAHHAGNWYVNSHSIGIEHEGFAAQGDTWYSEALYQASARLVRYLAEKYDIPLDRAHIIGHDNIPGQTPAGQAAMHWDPGPFWDWAHYMDLLGAPIASAGGGTSDRIVTIDPPFATNQPTVSDCDAGACQDLPKQPASVVYLRTAPSFDAPLLADPALARPGRTLDQGTTRIDDWGDTAATGQEFYRAGQQGDWTAIYFGGQQAWFYNPGSAANSRPGSGTLVTPKAGLAPIPVYGEAYPEATAYPNGRSPASFAPLAYRIPAGQVYVATDLVTADYQRPRSVSALLSDLVVGRDRYYQIYFNHRLAFVKANDVAAIKGS